MKKKTTSLLACCFISITLVLSPASNTQVTVQAKAQKVYYVPGSSYAYHCTDGCRTLSRSKVIKKITVKKAKKLGLKACGVCYR